MPRCFILAFQAQFPAPLFCLRQIVNQTHLNQNMSLEKQPKKFNVQKGERISTKNQKVRNIQNVDYLDIRGGGPDFHACPKFK